MTPDLIRGNLVAAVRAPSSIDLSMALTRHPPSSPRFRGGRQLRPGLNPGLRILLPPRREKGRNMLELYRLSNRVSP